MAMQWDSVLVRAVADELREELVGSRLQGHLFDWDRRLLTLFFRDRTLRWHLHPSAGWVVLAPSEDLPAEAKPLAAEVRAVEAPPDERVLQIQLRKIRGRERRIRLVVELLTNQWNALLLEGKEEWIRHLLWTRRLPERTLVSGQSYRSPPPSEREGAREEIPEARWRELVQNAGDEDSSRLLDRLAFTSPVNLPGILGPDGFALWTALKSGTDRQPCVLETTRGKQPYPLVIDEFKNVTYPSILEAIQAASQAAAEGDTGDSAADEGLRRALHQARGRVRGLEREMAQAADPEVLREQANLLLARLGEVARGADRVTLKGFSGEDVTLDLDPSLSPHENAQALYEEAARRERAVKRLPTLLEKAREKVANLEAVEAAWADGTLSADDVFKRLPSTKAQPRWKASDGSPRLPFRRFRSSGGLEIRVGRGSKDNDALTFKHSHPDDIWLHAREAGGAHVVLRWREEGSPPARDLDEAAALAALNSKARGSQTVPVDWTRRKYVRKPRKAPPGTVTLERAKTVFVEPDPELPDRLAWEQ